KRRHADLSGRVAALCCRPQPLPTDVAEARPREPGVRAGRPDPRARARAGFDPATPRQALPRRRPRTSLLDPRLKAADGAPLGIGNARGVPLFNVNARVTKNITFAKNQKIGVFIEVYNLTNRANFGNSFGANAASPATYGLPTGYIGGIGAVSTIPNSFQTQLGARFSF